MNDFQKSIMDKDYDTFRANARSYMTKKLCTDKRIVEYMERKEKYQDIAKSLKTSREKFEE